MIRTILSRRKVSKYEPYDDFSACGGSGIVCGFITSVIVGCVFIGDIENIVRYLDSIRGEVSVALDELSGDGEIK